MKAAARALSLALVGCCAGAIAHEDTPLTVAPDGAIVGLPAAYAPATLKLGFLRVDGEPRIGALSLAVRGARVEVPTCVLGLLNTERAADTRLTGSWEHDESVLPHYLSLKLFDPGYDAQAGANPGFSMLFDLRSARLIEMTFDVVHARERRVQSVPVDLRARCDPDEIAAFTPAANRGLSR